MITLESIKFRMLLAGLPILLLPKDDVIETQIKSCNQMELLDWLKKYVELELDNNSKDFIDVIKEKGKYLL